MQVKIKHYVDTIEDLNPNKVYDVLSKFTSNVLVIQDDVGATLYIRLSSCAHLNGGSWEIVND